MILFVSGEYPPDVGGIADYTARLRAELNGLGCPSGIVSRTQVRRWDARALVWLARHAPPHGVVHIQYQAAAFDLLGDICLLPLALRLRRRLRVVTTFHDARLPYLFPKAGRLRSAALQLLAQTSHAVLAADERDLATLGGPSPRHHVVPIGSNVACSPSADPAASRAQTRARLGFADGDLVLIYFGLLNASKGLDTLLDALSLVISQRPDLRMLVLGGGIGASDPTDRVTATAIERGFEGFGQRIVQPGYLAPAELSAHLLAADVAVLPYVDGASPRRGSLLACAAHGLPIVSTEPASQAVADAVLAVPAGDAGALSAAVLRIDGDAELAERLRDGSRALTTRSSWRSIAQRHVAIYREVGWPSR